ncbi:MAG TPA: hypothetical protein VMG60_15665 [Burkholderiaceae bacterium]|nr:hypothetical protein [Burkholderiaceae bacterium]
MTRFNSALAFAAVLACASLSTGAPAQEKSKLATADNAQATTSHSMSANKTKMQHKAQLGKNAVRDWKAIDKNHDNLIEPEEMEAYLKQKS